MVLMALAFLPAMAQVSNEGRVFYTMPKMEKQHTEDGRIYFEVQADGKTWHIYDQFGAPFPPGTEAGRSQRLDGKWEIRIIYPTGATTLVMANMVRDAQTGSVNANAQIQEFDFVGWERDRAEIPASTMPKIDELIQNIQISVIKIKVYVLGGVSDENIRHAECYRGETSPYYLPKDGAENFQKVTGEINSEGDNVACQALLADGREKTFRDYLVNHGINPDMIQLSRWGGIIDIDNTHFNNRGVRVLLIPITIYEQLKKDPPPPAPVIDIYQINTEPGPQSYTAPPPPASSESDECWKWALGGGLGGAGLGWGVSQIQVDGGKGANNAGDGGSVSVCGDNPAACIGGGVLLGAGGAYVGCRIYKSRH